MIKNLVSICIPTYNGEEYLLECLESINKQTYSDCEVVISDDGSTDKTMNLVNDYLSISKYPITIIKNPKTNKGIGGNWNNCVKSARGEFIKFLFQDDIMSPDCVSKMVIAINKSRDLGLIYCRRRIIYEPENKDHLIWIKRNSDLHKNWHSTIIGGGEIIKGRDLLKDANLIFHYPRNKFGEPSAVLLRKMVFNKVGYFNTDLRQSLDYEFWNRILVKFSTMYIDEELISFRLHEKQASAINSQSKLNEKYVFYSLTLINLFKYLSQITIIKIVFYKFKIVFYKWRYRFFERFSL